MGMSTGRVQELCKGFALVAVLIGLPGLIAQNRQGSGDRAGSGRVERNVDTPLLRVGVLAYCPAPALDYPKNQPTAAVSTLAADGRFGSVSLVAADLAQPSSANLRANYDCVVAITDLGCAGPPIPGEIADPAANALAEYATAGGGVVVAAFGFASPRPSLGFGPAIFTPGLSPLLGNSIYNSWSAGYINTGAMSTAPGCAKITAGVTGPITSVLANDTEVAAGATNCVSYATGLGGVAALPAVAVNARGNVVGFNSLPSSDDHQAQAGYRRLFGNSVYQACTYETPASVTAAVPVDIKPESCPNEWNSSSSGVLPVAILGTAGLPVSKIDPASIRLAGVTPERYSYADTGTPYAPFTGKTSCAACTSAGRDGLQDLELKFDSGKLAAALPGGAVSACVVLKLTGRLKAEFGGTEINGEDVLSVKRK